MSFDAHADALRMELPCPEKMVLAILCHYASDDTHSCWASLDTLSFTVGVSKQTIRNKLKSLKDKGYIKRIIERAGTTTVYVLDFAKIAQNARPRPLKEIDPSTSLTPQGDVPPPSTSLTPPLNLVDPINNYKQLNKETVGADRFQRPSLDDCREQAVTKGLPKEEGEKFWEYNEARDWMMGKSRMKNWKLGFATWARNFNNRQPAKPKSKKFEVIG